MPKFRVLVDWVTNDGTVRRLRVPMDPSSTIQQMMEETARRVGEDVGGNEVTADGALLSGEDTLEVVEESLLRENPLEQLEEDEGGEVQVAPPAPVEEVQVEIPPEEPSVPSREPLQLDALSESDEEEEGDAGDSTIRLRFGTPEVNGYRSVRVSLDDTITQLKEAIKEVLGHHGEKPNQVWLWTTEYPIQPRSSDETMVKECGLENGDVIWVVVSYEEEDVSSFVGRAMSFRYSSSWNPHIIQTEKGNCSFLSCLFVAVSYLGEEGEQREQFLGKLMRVFPFPPFVHTMRLLCTNRTVTSGQKTCVAQCLWRLFRHMIPAATSDDTHVFEYSRVCLAHVMRTASAQDSGLANFEVENLIGDLQFSRLEDPVRVRGSPGDNSVYSRAAILAALDSAEARPDWMANVTENDISTAEDVALLLTVSGTGLDMVVQTEAPMMMLLVEHTYRQHRVLSPVDTEWREMEARVDSCAVLRVYSGLRLKLPGLQSPCLSLYVNAAGAEPRLFSCTREMKGEGHNKKLFDPIHGVEKSVNPDEIARILPEHASVAEGGLVESQPPIEVTVVCVDKSYSMLERVPEMCDPRDDDHLFRRMDLVKACFSAFADRSMAYFGSDHWISLISFSSDVSVDEEPTAFFAEFAERVQEIQAKGLTVLHQAVSRAALVLEDVHGRYPDAKLRVLCLTDGFDSSMNAAVDPEGYRHSVGYCMDACRRLRVLEAVVDGAIIGDIESKSLLGLATATGGVCFNPATLEEGLRIFQQEAFLSLSMRRPQDCQRASDHDVSSFEQLLRLGTRTNYKVMLEPPQPALLQRPIMSSVNAMRVVRSVGVGSLATAIAHRAAEESSESQTPVARETILRVLHELEAMTRENIAYLRVFPSEENILFWRVLMQGPEDSPYAGGCFLLYLRFPERYPEVSPEVRFVSKVHHPNINSAGRICHPIFQENWQRDVEVSRVLYHVHALLKDPEADDPLDSAVAMQYLTNRPAFDHEVGAMVVANASVPMAEMERRLLGGEESRTLFSPPPSQQQRRRGGSKGRERKPGSPQVPSTPPQGAFTEDPPDRLVDPISHELFLRETVVSPNGNTYDRLSLERWVRTNQTDPMTRERLTLDRLKELPRNRAIESEAAEWLRRAGPENTWVVAAASLVEDDE